MSDYVLLYSGGSRPETEEEQAQVMKAWTGWFETIGSALKDGGNPFGPTARTVSGGGSVSDASASFTGYTIVAAASFDAAADIAKGSPVLDAGGTVTVYEVVPAM